MTRRDCHPVIACPEEPALKCSYSGSSRNAPIRDLALLVLSKDGSTLWDEGPMTALFVLSTLSSSRIFYQEPGREAPEPLFFSSKDGF